MFPKSNTEIGNKFSLTANNQFFFSLLDCAMFKPHCEPIWGGSVACLERDTAKMVVTSQICARLFPTHPPPDDVIPVSAESAPNVIIISTRFTKMLITISLTQYHQQRCHHRDHPGPIGSLITSKGIILRKTNLVFFLALTRALIVTVVCYI